jgi:predicted metal-dependent phosphoesterase TrpH
LTFDLHCHSDCSDGELSPQSLLDRASLNGVRCLSITDHDTLACYREHTLRVPDGMQLIPGLELSSQWRGRGIHIVGLNVAPDHDALLRGTALQQQTRIDRARIISDRLARLGFEGAFDRAMELAGGNAIGRPHFARFLVETGAVKDSKQAFKKYLGTGKTGDVRRGWADMEAVISWIRDAGGIAVLAHPAHYKLTKTRLRKLVADFRAAGGRSVEVVSGNQTEETTESLADLCLDNDMLASCGSDFHRTSHTWSDLGRFRTLPERCTPVWTAWA